MKVGGNELGKQVLKEDGASHGGAEHTDGVEEAGKELGLAPEGLANHVGVGVGIEYFFEGDLD